MSMRDVKPMLERQLDGLREPFAVFISAQATASGLLLLALVAALIVSNTPLAEQLNALRHFSLGIAIGDSLYRWSLQHIVNDGLIAVFFFLIGLEVKRELLAGELRDRRRVGLLMSAASGGMLVPAALYLLINQFSPDGVPDGWAVPMATDTALAIGVLTALTGLLPRSAVAFLVGVAIIDDIGAILVIASVYTQGIDLGALSVALLLFALLLVINRAGFRQPLLYILPGIGVWAAIVQSGIHASIAGVIVAATVPARPRITPRRLKWRMRRAVEGIDPRVPTEQVLGDANTHEQLAKVEHIAEEGSTPLRRWENGLELPVALLILPLFAFLNAGVIIDPATLGNALTDPVSLGIICGLVVGKPVGLILGVKVGEWLGVASLPSELNGKRLLGLGLLAGIGFTMSNFMSHLAFGGQAGDLETSKLAIILASAVAALAGYLVLRHPVPGPVDETPARPSA